MSSTSNTTRGRGAEGLLQDLALPDWLVQEAIASELAEDLVQEELEHARATPRDDSSFDWTLGSTQPLYRVAEESAPAVGPDPSINAEVERLAQQRRAGLHVVR